MKIKCDCGGTLRPVRLKDFDATEDLGVPVVVKQIQGLRCARCGFETLDGKTFKQVAAQAAAQIIALPERLPRPYLHYLRMYLDLTQKELAERIGITRKTVSEWEMQGGRISPQHDLILRVLVYVQLSAATPPPVGMPALRELAQAISHVRTAAPKRRPAPLRLLAMRVKAA